MGFKKPHDFSLRHLFGNNLANNASISLKECMLALRHSSASATLNYQERNQFSEENRLEAMGFVPHQDTSMSSQAVVQKSTTSSQVATYPVIEDENEEELIDLQHESMELLKSAEEVKNSPTQLTSHQFAQYSQGFCDMDTYVQHLGNASSTQAAIDIVKHDIEALKTETNMIGEDKSAERNQIILLGEEVRDLRMKCNSMAKKLYFYEEMKRKGQLIFTSTRTPDRKRPRILTPPINPYLKLK